MPSVLIVRGHLANPWELRPWLELPDRYEVSYLLTGSNRFLAPKELRAVPVRALRDVLPHGRVGELSAMVLGDRYLSAEEAFAQADIVHAAELSFWSAAEAARRRRRHGFRLVQTVWETLPLLAAYRNRHARRYRELVLAETDLFLAATERAALALGLEGASRPSGSRSARPGSTRLALPRLSRPTRPLRRTRAAPRVSLERTRFSQPGGSCGRRVTRTCCARSRCSTAARSAPPRGRRCVRAC